MLNNYTYLYVEDNELSRDVMAIIMHTGMGIDKLTVFADSENFLSRLKALDVKPDIILLDIHVPPLNGFEVLHLVKSEAGYENVKVIAVTASVMNEEIKKLRTSGFDGAISKPISIQTFPDLIKKILLGEAIWHIG